MKQTEIKQEDLIKPNKVTLLLSLLGFTLLGFALYGIYKFITVVVLGIHC